MDLKSNQTSLRIRIRFEKKVRIDNQFLFTVDQKIINDSQKTYNFYPYGQIVRNKAPQVTNFYILHEGLIGVFDEQLVEQDYEDIIEKKFSKNTKSGWLGITDKYWITTLIPEKNKEFRADFDFKNKFRANFIETSPIEVGANSSDSSKIKIIVAAKEVDVIDGYAENSNIDTSTQLLTSLDSFFTDQKPKARAAKAIADTKLEPSCIKP